MEGRNEISTTKSKNQKKKWYFRHFYHLVVINAWIVQIKVLTIENTEKEIAVTLAEFREILSESLRKTGEHEMTPKKRGRPNFFLKLGISKKTMS